MKSSVGALKSTSRCISSSSLQLEREEPLKVPNNCKTMKLAYCFSESTNRRGAGLNAWGGWGEKMSHGGERDASNLLLSNGGRESKEGTHWLT